MNPHHYQIENTQSIETVCLNAERQGLELRRPKVRPVRARAALPEWDLEVIAAAMFNIRVW